MSTLISSVVKVCNKHKLSCDNKTFMSKIGSTSYLYCCKKGFEKTLVEFRKQVT